MVRAVGLNPTEGDLSGAGSGEKDLAAVQAFVKKLDESKPSKSDVESKVSRPPPRPQAHPYPYRCLGLASTVEASAHNIQLGLK